MNYENCIMFYDTINGVCRCLLKSDMLFSFNLIMNNLNV